MIVAIVSHAISFSLLHSKNDTSHLKANTYLNLDEKERKEKEEEKRPNIKFAHLNRSVKMCTK